MLSIGAQLYGQVKNKKFFMAYVLAVSLVWSGRVYCQPLIPSEFQTIYNDAIYTVLDRVAEFNADFLPDYAIICCKDEEGEIYYSEDQLDSTPGLTHPNEVIGGISYFYAEDSSNNISLAWGAFCRGSSDLVSSIILAGTLVHEATHCCQTTTAPPISAECQIMAFQREADFLFDALTEFWGDLTDGERAEIQAQYISRLEMVEAYGG